MTATISSLEQLKFLESRYTGSNEVSLSILRRDIVRERLAQSYEGINSRTAQMMHLTSSVVSPAKIIVAVNAVAQVARAPLHASKKAWAYRLRYCHEKARTAEDEEFLYWMIYAGACSNYIRGRRDVGNKAHLYALAYAELHEHKSKRFIPKMCQGIRPRSHIGKKRG